MANVKFNERDKAIVKVLKDSENGMTLAELIQATGMELKPAHLTSAKTKGLIEVIGEREVERMGKRKVASYVFVSKEPQLKEDGKPFSYTENEQTVLASACQFDKPFTLAELGAFMGKKLTSGSVNGLVKKGNIQKGDQVEAEAIVKASVNVYGFIKDIPAGE